MRRPACSCHASTEPTVRPPQGQQTPPPWWPRQCGLSGPVQRQPKPILLGPDRFHAAPPRYQAQCARLALGRCGGAVKPAQETRGQAIVRDHAKSLRLKGTLLHDFCSMRGVWTVASRIRSRGERAVSEVAREIGIKAFAQTHWSLLGFAGGMAHSGIRQLPARAYSA